MIQTGARKFAVTPQAEKPNKDEFESAEVSRAWLHCFVWTSSAKTLVQGILLWPAPIGSFMGDAANSNLEGIAAVNCILPSPPQVIVIVGSSDCSHWLLATSNIAWVLLI